MSLWSRARTWLRPPRPIARDGDESAPAESASAGERSAGDGPVALSPRDGGYVVTRGGATLAVLEPAPGVLLFEVVERVAAGGGVEWVTSAYDLDERRGSVLAWAAPRERGRVVTWRTILLGPPESVLWWLALDGTSVLVRDTRHRVSYRIGEEGAAEVGAQESAFRRERPFAGRTTSSVIGSSAVHGPP